MTKALLISVLLFFLVISNFSHTGKGVEVGKQHSVIGRYAQVPQGCNTPADCTNFCQSIGYKSCGCNAKHCCCIIPPPSS